MRQDAPRFAEIRRLGDDIIEVDGEEVVGSSSGIFSLLPPTKEDDLSPPVMCVGGSVPDPNSQCEHVPAAGGLLAARAPEGRDGGRRRRRHAAFPRRAAATTSQLWSVTIGRAA